MLLGGAELDDLAVCKQGTGVAGAFVADFAQPRGRTQPSS